MVKKPEIVVVSVAHRNKYVSETLEGLSKAGVGKGTLVLVETPESIIKNPNEVKADNWVQGINFFVADRKAHISSIEPENIVNVRSIAAGFRGMRSSIMIGTDLGAEDIMSEIIKQKAKGRKKVVVVTGGFHGSRIPDLLKAKGFNVKFIDATPSDYLSSSNITDHFSKRDALLRGYGQYQKSGEMKDIKHTQIKKMQGSMDMMKKIKWKMPATFRFGENGKLVPLKGRITRKR